MLRSKNIITIGLCITIVLALFSFTEANPENQSESMKPKNEEVIRLPQPTTSGDLSVEAAISQRRSVRDFSDKPLSLDQLSQLLWAAQGITGPEGKKRAAPSAGALYPLELYVVAGSYVKDLEKGVYHYIPEGHKIERVKAKDLRADLSSAALNQEWVEEAPLSIVITGVYESTTRKYKHHGERYVHMEAGHIGENLALQAGSLGLGMVTVGAFQANQVQKVLNLPNDNQPLYIIPMGHPK
ncbi:MAG: SagB/ThcOx family dehydrogenase [Bacteroidales bacterium]|nr:SagB/ThcOx family dehydrogenase [Bacteroidales bacterium]MCF8332656.1 SagB/ThcOx family dehydrogenase [Bacteroidales bacterium]